MFVFIEYFSTHDILNVLYCRFYCQEDIRAYEILFGEIPRPAQAEELYEILDSFIEKYENDEQNNNMRKMAREHRKVYFVSLSA